MLTSEQVLAQMQAQQQAFQGQAAFANSIGIAPPSFAPPRAMGLNYAPPSYAGGNAFAGRAMAGMGAAYSGVEAGVGMYGLAQGGLGLARGLMGGGAVAGGAAAGGLGAAAMGVAAPMALSMLASQGIQSFMHGGQQQQQIGSALGSFQHFNPQSRTGAGFSRDDAMAIGDSVRQLSHIPEMMSSVEELTKLMPRLKATGVMQGVRDASEFASRFKESVKTIRDISKVLGSSMEEAEQFFASSRSVGFLGRKDQVQNALNAQYTSGVTGMSSGQVMQLQRAGADMGTQFGVSRKAGAQAVTNIAQTLGLAQQQGSLREGILEDITGAQGPEAIQQASQRFAGAVANIAKNSPAGRLSIAGLAKFDESGKAVGLDESLVKQYTSGSLSREDLMRRASSLTNTQKISFTTRQNELAMQFAAKAGPGGIAQFLQGVAGDKYGAEGVNLLLQRQGGLSSTEADVFQQMQGQGGGIGQDMEGLAQIRAREASIRDNRDPTVLMQKLKTKIKAATTGKIEEAGAKVFNSMSKAYDDFVDDIVGRHAVALSQGGADKFARAMAGGGGKDFFKDLSGTEGLIGQSKRFGLGDKTSIGGLAVSGLTGMLAGGPLGALVGMGGAAVGSALGGGDLMGALKRGAGAAYEGLSGLVSGNETGRSEQSQNEHMAGLLGGRASMSAAASILGRGVKGAEVASGDLDRIKRGIDNFSEMTSARRLDEVNKRINESLTSAVSGGNQYLYTRPGEKEVMNALSKGDVDEAQRLAAKYKVDIDKSVDYLSQNGNADGKSAARLIKAGLAAQKAGFKGDFATGIALGQKQKGSIYDISVDKTFSGVDVLDVAALDNLRKDRISKLQGVIGAGAAATLAAGGTKAEILQSIAKGDGRVQEALEKESPEAAVRALQELGYTKIKPEDVKALQDQSRDILKAKDNGRYAVSKTMEDFDKIQNLSDKAVLRKQALTKAGDLAEALKGKTGSQYEKVQALQKALGLVGSTTGGGAELQKAIGDVTDQIESLSRSGKTEDIKQRDELLRSLGPEMSSSLGRVIGGEKSLRGMVGKGGTSTRGEIAAKLGVSAESLEGAFTAAGIGEKVDFKRLSAGNLEMFLKKAREAGLAGGISGGGGKTLQEGAGSVENQTLEALGKLNKSLDMNTTVIAAFAKKEGVPLPDLASLGAAGRGGDAKPDQKAAG